MPKQPLKVKLLLHAQLVKCPVVSQPKFNRQFTPESWAAATADFECLYD
jgi:hypothetical protein